MLDVSPHIVDYDVAVTELAMTLIKLKGERQNEYWAYSVTEFVTNR